MSDLTQLAAEAGFSGADLATAAAIAMAESGGDPGKYNPETQASGGTPAGQGSYGLWQIYLKKHPEFAGWDLLDPQVNARAAYEVYSREGFSAWTTYKTGSYKSFLQPLTIDNSTGQPIPAGESFPAEFAQAGILPAEGLSFGKVLLWGALGLLALWLFEEAA